MPLLHASHPASQFEDLVEKILNSKYRNVVRLVGDPLADFTVDAMLAVEVRYYRTTRAQLSLVESAAAQLANSRQAAPNRYRRMLIVSCSIPSSIRDAIELQYGIELVDRNDLAQWVSKDPELIAQLSDLLVADFEEDSEKKERPHRLAGDGSAKTPPPPSTLGTELSDALLSHKAGKGHWRAYETLCDRILRYLFPNDLQGWHKQTRTDDGVSRYDYVCRIVPTTEFWKFLISNLNSRYIIFEFKNYRTAIKQGQVLTTEKYLLEKGLRRVAIILTRKGADRGAMAMIQGAMREHGKLMLVVDDDLVRQMLLAKERGSDPSDLLFDLADHFLLSLPR